MSSEVTRLVFEYTVTRALRALLLRILHQYPNTDISADDNVPQIFPAEVMQKLDKCGAEILPETFAGEIVYNARIYHHGLNSIGFHRAQCLLLDFLKAKSRHIETLKLKQIITAQQRYTLRKADALCLDVYNIDLHTLIVLFRDFFPNTLKSFSENEGLKFDLLDFIYEISSLHRGFFHGEFPSYLLRDVIEKCSKLRVNYIRSVCASMNKSQLRFWNSYLVSYFNFVCNLDETRSNIPIHVKRKSRVARIISTEAPRIYKTHGSHGPLCECARFTGTTCMCTRHSKRRKRHHSAEGLYSDLLDKVKSAEDLCRPLKRKICKHFSRQPSIRDLVEYECYGPDCLTNIFVNEARFSIGKICINDGRETGTAVCIGKGFILSAYHIFEKLLDPELHATVKSASICFGKNVVRLKEPNSTHYRVISCNQKEDWVIIEIHEAASKQMDFRPLRMSMTETKDEPKQHPEGWPLCMHAAGYSTGKLTVNERMKILHPTEKERKIEEFEEWFDLENYTSEFSLIASKLNKRKGRRYQVFRKFLFPRETEIFFMSGLLHGASGSPCLVFDQYNHPIIHAVLLGACPTELFNYTHALKSFPVQFIFRRGVTASKIYNTLREMKSQRHFKISEHQETKTWILTSLH